MDTKRMTRGADPGVAWGWKQTLWHQMEEIETLIDRMALRLGDALFGVQSSEKLFGPHPSAF